MGTSSKSNINHKWNSLQYLTEAKDANHRHQVRMNYLCCYFQIKNL
jgi:hypothetical protein